MAVNLSEPGKLLPVAGVRLGTTNAGIKQTERDDLALLELAPGSRCAAVFTRNAFCAAPVALARKHLANAAPRYLLINSGNANAGTGQAGYDDAVACCAGVAQTANTAPESVLPFSTGVIGMRLPVAKITAAVPRALEQADTDNWAAAARAIMTTDTLAKAVSRQIRIDGATITVTGMAKGSGMIRPDMATMLAFIATDAALSQAVLQDCLNQAVAQSFNRITVDGDTSTNDACVLIASGQSDLAEIDAPDSPARLAFQNALDEVCRELAQAIIRDGEGATKFISIQVQGGQTEEECLQVAYTVAHSPLVKTAFFASDANWGRILAAVGRAGLSDLVLEDVRIELADRLQGNRVCIVENGGSAPQYTEQQGSAIMAASEIDIRIQLGRGEIQQEVWTCDLSHDYVRINAEYRT